MPPPWGGHFGIARSIRMSPGAAVKAVGTLAACGSATAGHQTGADCGPVRGRTYRPAAIFATVELPSARGGGHIVSAFPGLQLV